MTDIADRHHPNHDGSWCILCGASQDWPCDAEQMRRERDEAVQDGKYQAARWLRERDAAEADAKALYREAKAMHDYLQPCSTDDNPCSTCRVLAAYDKDHSKGDNV